MGRKSSSMIDKVCELCGESYTVRGNKRGRERRFCSSFCAKSFNGQQNKGRTYSDEVNKKKGLPGKSNPFYGRVHTDKTKQLISEKLTGNSHTLEWREEQSRRMSGERNPFYGKTHTEETRSMLGRDMSGENNPMFGKGHLLVGERNGAWVGGISELYTDYGGAFTKELKTEVRRRDKFVCQICEKHGWVVHHIDYNKHNNDPTNLSTLCASCHGKTNWNREEWQSYFEERLLNE